MARVFAPIRKSVIAEVMRDHPEIDARDEDSPNGRARILDYAIDRLNKQPAPAGCPENPWGRKARRRIDVDDPTTGVDLNTDGLTLLRNDDRFEIIDAISGVDGSATWDHHGDFAQGENGFWAPGRPVDDDREKPGPVPRPQPRDDEPPREVIVFREKPPALDYGQQMKLAEEIAVVLAAGRYRGNDRAIAQVISHLLWKVQEEGYPVQAAIDNANRRARGEQAD